MLRPVLRSYLAASLCAAGAAHAGIVYVPSPGIAPVGGATYEVQISITNTAAAANDVKQALLATNSDGTQRPVLPSTVTVQPGRTAVVKPGSSFRGLVELNGGNDLRYSARLTGTGPGRLGVYLPVITADNLVSGGKTVYLQGLIGGSGRATDLTLLNLASTASQCTASLFQADGTLLAGPVTIAMKPLSHQAVSDIFSGGSAVDARATVSCTQSFFAYALISDAATGEVSYVGPAGNGSSGIGGTPPPASCPTGAICFDAKGIVHQPTPAHRVQRVTFPAPAGNLSRLRMSLDVTVGPWYAPDPAGKALLYWFVLNRNFDMFGTFYFRGPDPVHPAQVQSEALLRHGLELTHPQKLKIEQPFQAQVGRTYHVEEIYDLRNGALSVTITDTATGQIVNQLVGVPNLRSWTLKPTDVFLIDMGFTGTNVDEVPSDGWTYANVHLEVYLQ
ncbi:MAG: hypothetical protein ACJ76Y_23045 [Thermoanaerobaculia bacterium]